MQIKLEKRFYEWAYVSLRYAGYAQVGDSTQRLNNQILHRAVLLLLCTIMEDCILTLREVK
jgi:hypothetical protein